MFQLNRQRLRARGCADGLRLLVECSQQMANFSSQLLVLASSLLAYHDSGWHRFCSARSRRTSVIAIQSLGGLHFLREALDGFRLLLSSSEKLRIRPKFCEELASRLTFLDPRVHGIQSLRVLAAADLALTQRNGSGQYFARWKSDDRRPRAPRILRTPARRRYWMAADLGARRSPRSRKMGDAIPRGEFRRL